MTVQKDPEQNETRYLRKHADLTGKRVLEVGCGDGRLTWRYAKIARLVAGIDLDGAGLRTGWIERPSDLEHVAFFTQADCTHLPFSTVEFDAAVLAWSF